MREMAEISSVSKRRHVPKEPIGELLVRAGKLRRADLATVLNRQQQHGLRFGEAAIALGLIKQTDVQAALAEQFSYPVVLRADRSRLDRSVVTAWQPYSAQAEIFRSLRSELLLRWFDGPPEHRALAVISVDDGERPGQFAANLGVVFAQASARTLLIDADLRQPRLHRLLGSDNRMGLSNLLAGHADATVATVEPFETLFLLSSGSVPPNPQELLASPRFSRWLADAARQFDVVLLNVPSLGTCADAQLVAARAGAALLIVQDNVSRMADLDAARRKLVDAGVAVLGVCLLD